MNLRIPEFLILGFALISKRNMCNPNFRRVWWEINI